MLKGLLGLIEGCFALIKIIIGVAVIVLVLAACFYIAYWTISFM